VRFACRDEYPQTEQNGLCLALVPATGTPVPGGLSHWGAVEIIEKLFSNKSANVIGADVNEISTSEGTNLTEFSAALETNDSAVAVLGDEILKTIARDVAKIIRSSTTIDWTMREEVQAQMRVLVKRILKKYGYPPDNAKKATDTVLEQAKLMASELASA